MSTSEDNNNGVGVKADTLCITVEPLTNDHPHLRPPAFYDRFFIDGMSTLYKRSLTRRDQRPWQFEFYS